MKTIHKSFFVLACLVATSCEKPLEEKIFSSLAPSTLFTTEAGISSSLNAAYAYSQRAGVTESWSPYWLSSMPTGEAYGIGGSIEALWTPLTEFTWNSNHGQLAPVWNVHYNGIRDANIVLDNIDKGAFSQTFKELATAEVHFIRGWNYSELYYLFGKLPLYKSTTDDLLQARASEEDTKAFIEQELLAAIPKLPVKASAFGRATKGAAQGVLCKFYLNTKQWQKAADLAKQIMDANTYSLLKNFKDIFALTNENNAEILWSLAKNAADPNTAQNLNALIFPPAYPFPYPNNSAFAARVYLFDKFVDSFDASDSRGKMMVRSFVQAGKEVKGYGVNQTLPFKYEWDPSAVGANAGNDLPVVRYADILLSRAEALNELSGPSAEVIALINQVRTRAGVSEIKLSDYTKESLRDFLLAERGKEFFLEMKSREDYLRQGKFISEAVKRGKNAKAYHVLYPIPQVELDANKALVQNEGY
ncbi:RagB/SusD family nutrient uptake outer membrane protein [Spirosoma gilvum]